VRRLDERRERKPCEDKGDRRSDEPVDGVSDDHALPCPLRKGCLTATVRDAMLLISMYVRRILTVPRDEKQTAAHAR
jgi:hypothetical protein